jgi:hypothetical protein
MSVGSVDYVGKTSGCSVVHLHLLLTLSLSMFVSVFILARLSLINKRMELIQPNLIKTLGQTYIVNAQFQLN